MFNFNKIQWDQVFALFKVLKTSSSFDLEIIEKWHNAESTNFEDTLNFFIDLGLIFIENGKVLLNEELKSLPVNNALLRNLFLKKILINKKNRINLFGDYFKEFVMRDGLFIFVPSLEERLRYSGIRNFLLSIGVLQFNPQDKSYVLEEWLSQYIVDLKYNLSYNKFIEETEAANELGNKAEIMIIEMEKSRLIAYPDLQKKIEHAAFENVRAGYDIKSYEIRQPGKWFEKYIEVKAVSEKNLGFYWSRNEIEKARQLSENYYLYLLPVSEGESIEISKLKEIKNTYKEIYKNQNKWKQEIELMSFSINEQHKY